jgi:transcriptional regulator with XRE-family HTH domain
MAQKRSEANQALGQAIRELRSNYGSIERGEFNVRVDTLLKIARALRLPLAALFRRAGSSSADLRTNS